MNTSQLTAVQHGPTLDMGCSDERKHAGLANRELEAALELRRRLCQLNIHASAALGACLHQHCNSACLALQHCHIQRRGAIRHSRGHRWGIQWRLWASHTNEHNEITGTAQHHTQHTPHQRTLAASTTYCLPVVSASFTFTPSATRL